MVVGANGLAQMVRCDGKGGARQEPADCPTEIEMWEPRTTSDAANERVYQTRDRKSEAEERHDVKEDKNEGKETFDAGDAHCRCSGSVSRKKKTPGETGQGKRKGRKKAVVQSLS